MNFPVYAFLIILFFLNVKYFYLCIIFDLDPAGSYFVHEPKGSESKDPSSSLTVTRLASSQQEHLGTFKILLQIDANI